MFGVNIESVFGGSKVEMGGTVIVWRGGAGRCGNKDLGGDLRGLEDLDDDDDDVDEGGLKSGSFLTAVEDGSGG